MAAIVEKLAAALRHHQAGHRQAAEELYRSILAMDPGQPDALHLLGVLAHERGEHLTAIDYMQESIRRKGSVGAYHNNLGEAHRAAGNLPAAMACYRRALELQPDNADAHSNLGVAWVELGDSSEAEAQFRRALQLRPNFAPALCRLATVRCGNLSDADLAAIEHALADGELRDDSRRLLLFALAQALDVRADYDRAAECSRQANALQLRLAAEPYDPATHDRFVDQIVETFNTGFFLRLAGGGLATQLPVFVVGLPRTGTTLIEQILASHPQVHGAGELPLVQQSFESAPVLLRRSAAPLDCLAQFDEAALNRLAEQHCEKLRAFGGADARRIVDKMPESYLYLGLLAAMFPRATFIHCRRDPRDVAVSCWMNDFQTIAWANDFAYIGARFRQHHRLMAHWRAVLPAPIHEVDYEETVGDLEGVARRLVSACGLEWDPACLEFHRARRPIRTASVSQARRPIYQKSVGRWRNYELALADLFARLPCAEDA